MHPPVVLLLLLLLLLLSWWFQSGKHKTDSEGFGFQLRATKTESRWKWVSETGPVGRRMRQVQPVKTPRKQAGSRHFMSPSSDPRSRGGGRLGLSFCLNFRSFSNCLFFWCRDREVAQRPAVVPDSSFSVCDSECIQTPDSNLINTSLNSERINSGSFSSCSVLCHLSISSFMSSTHLYLPSSYFLTAHGWKLCFYRWFTIRMLFLLEWKLHAFLSSSLLFLLSLTASDLLLRLEDRRNYSSGNKKGEQIFSSLFLLG